MTTDQHDRQRLAVVTGGGGGIGAAIAEELGRSGTFVVTVDPLVSLDGTEQLADPDETTAGRIVAAGGAARASSASVTDLVALRGLFAALAEEFGGLDAVVNFAGITRPTSFSRGSDDDWRSVLSVHLDGYRNVLAAALPIMSAAGHGHILGVTSGSGWRAADTGAYGCAKRAVASLTWQLGRSAPPGVVVNAVSPIAMTRMVRAALERQQPSKPARSKAAPSRSSDSTASGSKSSTTGGLSLGAMPTPRQLGPSVAHLVSDGFSTCRGRVLFTAGTEMALVDEPRLIEVLPSGSANSLASVLQAVTPLALVPAELNQASNGGSNPRLGSASDSPAPDSSASDSPALDGSNAAALPPSEIQSCAVVSDRTDLADAVVSAIEARGVKCRRVGPEALTSGFDAAGAALTSALNGNAVGAVVLALANDPVGSIVNDWEGTLAEHRHIVDGICTDAAWSRAVADLAAADGRPIRMVTLTDATAAGGRSRAQASAQLARAALGATEERVAAFSVSVETSAPASFPIVGEVAAHLACSPQTLPLSGAELMVGEGMIGLRSHPRVGASVIFGGTAVPDWFDDVLAGIVR